MFEPVNTKLPTSAAVAPPVAVPPETQASNPVPFTVVDKAESEYKVNVSVSTTFA